MQYALADYVTQAPEHYLGLADFYQAKRDLFCGFLRDTRFAFEPTRGTYFQLVDYRAYSNDRDVDFVAALTQQHGVAAIPLSVFYADPPSATLIRFCFCKHDATLRKAGEILCGL